VTKIAIEVSADDRKASAAILKLQSRVQELEASLRNVSREGKKSGEAVSKGFGGAAGDLATAVVGLFSVQRATQLVGESFRTMIKNIEETAGAATKAAGQMTGLAASSVGSGSVRAKIIQAREMFIAQGVTREERGSAIDMLDELQDAMQGTFLEAVREAGELFSLHKLGMKDPDLLAIGKAAGARGMDPGAMGRKVFEAGERGGVSPATIAKMMPTISMFPSPDQGLAIAAILAPLLREREAPAAMASVEQLLAGRGPEEFKKIAGKKFGITEGMPALEQLERFRAAGIDTIPEFRALKLDEGMAKPMSILVSQLDRLKRLTKEIPAAATETMVRERIAGVEAEMPEMAQVWKNARTKAHAEFLQEMGVAAVESLSVEGARRVRAVTLRRRGIEQIGWFDAINENQQATWLAKITTDIEGRFDDLIDSIRTGIGLEAKPPGRWNFAGVRLEEEMRVRGSDPVLKALQDNTAATKENTQRTLRGGPALVPADVDR